MGRRRAKHAVEYALFRALRSLLGAAPERWALQGGAALGWFAGVVLRIRRRAVDRNLQIAFPEESSGWRARNARACYAHLGREFVAVLRLARADPQDVVARTEVSGLEELRAAIAQTVGRGMEPDNIVTGKQMWWFAESQLGMGPFRWLVFQNKGGPLLAESESFWLPDHNGAIMTQFLDLSQ